MFTEVRGLSSETIYSFMTGAVDTSYPKAPGDVGDWERNRALLLCFPEWRKRLPEMKVLSVGWNNLVNHWSRIEAMYDAEIAMHGRAIYDGPCSRYIKFLVNRYDKLGEVDSQTAADQP